MKTILFPGESCIPRVQSMFPALLPLIIPSLPPSLPSCLPAAALSNKDGKKLLPIKNGKYTYQINMLFIKPFRQWPLDL